VIAEKGKDALNQFLSREYKLLDGVYAGTSEVRAREALTILKAEVKARMEEIRRSLAE
jgi:hypothetical protein